MSGSLPNLEVEPEWCSQAMLSSVFGAAKSQEMSAAETDNLPAIEPCAEPLTASAAVSEVPQPAHPIPAHPARLASKSRSDFTKPRSRNSSHPTSVGRLLGRFRTRRVRIAVTALSVLIVCGLIALNWKSRSTVSDEEIAEMDLSEFNNALSIDASRIGSTSQPQPLDALSSEKLLPHADPFARMDSMARMPPRGLVTPADHVAMRGQTNDSLIPASASSSELRGAVLTGQIEFDTQSTSNAAARPFRNLGVR